MALKQKREQTIFQKQLEKAATRNIVFLVFIGCLFFSAAIFGINYLNTRFNVQEHIEFLTSTFQTAYYATDSYLNDTENDSVFTRCIEDGTNGSEVHYSLSKYNVDSPIDRPCADSLYGLHLIQVNQRDYDQLYRNDVSKDIFIGGLQKRNNRVSVFHLFKEQCGYLHGGYRTCGPLLHAGRLWVLPFSV